MNKEELMKNVFVLEMKLKMENVESNVHKNRLNRCVSSRY